ncbi:MAG: PDZ domain-containing protein [Pseudomonadota bacterium]|nr:PDZ domain-containing protein [Pseudomonadota bacterium]
MEKNMSGLKKASMITLTLLALICTAPALAKGKLGFSTETSTSGLLKPVIESAKVAKVRPGSAAASAGLVAGDLIIEVNGQPVKGAPAKNFAEQLKNIKAGEHLRLNVQRGKILVLVDILAGG